MRNIIPLVLLILAAACSNPSLADSPPIVERNLICERVAVLNAKTPCQPELSGVGDLHTHTARVTLEGKGQDGKPTSATVVCGLNAGQLAMVCGPLEAGVAKPAEAQAPSDKTADKPAKATK